MSKEIQFPADYGFARIGSTINYSTRELNATFYAFEMAKLNGLNLLASNTPTVRLTTRANTFSSATERAWSFSVDSKIKSSFLVCNAELGFHADLASGSSSSSSGMTLDVIYEESGYEIVLAKQATEQQLYECATPKFQQFYKAIADAPTPSDWLLAYQAFHDTFGHGFVSKLKLISYASGSLQFNHSTHLESDNQKWGGSFAISTLGSSASASSEYASSVKSAGSSGELQASVFGVPASSPALSWVKGMIDTYTGKGIDTLLKAPPENLALPTTSAKAPEIPAVVPPKGKNPLPEAKIHISNTDELVSYLKVKNHLKENGSDDVSLEEFMRKDAASKKAMAQAADASNRESLKLLDAQSIANDALKSADRKKPVEQVHAPLALAEKASEGAGSPDLALGGYAICGIEFTPYADLFPALRTRADMLSLAGIHVVRHQTFVLMQQLIAQYLNYVKDLPEVLRGTSIDKAAAEKFEKLVKEYATSSRETTAAKLSNGGTLSAEDCDRLRSEFFSRLRDAFASPHDQGHDPDICIINLYFLKHFRMLESAPFGFVLNVQHNTLPYVKTFPTKSFYLTRNDNAPFLYPGLPIPHDPISITNRQVNDAFLSEKCHRFMPIIRVVNKQPMFILATYINNLYSGLPAASERESLRDIAMEGVAPSATPPQVESLGGWAVIAQMSLDAWSTGTVAPVVSNVYCPYRTRMLGLQPGLPITQDDDGDDLENLNWPEGYVFSESGNVSFVVEQQGTDNAVVSMSRGAMLVNGQKGLRCDVGFIPVSYDMARSQNVQGIPMWCELPLKDFEAAAEGIYARQNR
ncbi:hypothetical protein [Pseudomonas japonica]|uniref:Uncharacterized protein n=1 Tax=Pseudomonas japonica TaxID=256466 RepID=A0A239KGG3_9PSED|nr:hypothetical protein [Pseudomonas japonica]SNT16224.1 hypothetical protein SAMN05444352_12650 [Pseudomonas japonica]